MTSYVFRRMSWSCDFEIHLFIVLTYLKKILAGERATTVKGEDGICMS